MTEHHGYIIILSSSFAGVSLIYHGLVWAVAISLDSTTWHTKASRYHLAVGELEEGCTTAYITTTGDESMIAAGSFEGLASERIEYDSANL